MTTSEQTIEGMSYRDRGRNTGNALPRLFLLAFLASCFWFWWLISFIYRFILGLEDPVSDWSLAMSIASASFFLLGFLSMRPGTRTTAFSAEILNRCEQISYHATRLLFVPAMIISSVFFILSVGRTYGQGGKILFADQAIFYLHLFFGFMFLGVVHPGGHARKRLYLVAGMLVLPRLLVSLNYGRIFVAQAVVPIVFIAVARGFIQLTWKRLAQIAVLGLFILFVPSLTRGDPVFTANDDDSSDTSDFPQIIHWVAAGSSLQVTQDYQDLDLSHRCPPLLVSLTGKLVPYALLHLCTVHFGNLDVAANLDRVVTHEIVGDADLADTGGTGTSYLLELYLSGGVPAVVIGSLLFGMACKRLAISMAARSLFSGIWAECLMRAIFAPRNMLGYVFEKIPVLVLATLAIAVLTYLLSPGTPPLNKRLRVGLS